MFLSLGINKAKLCLELALEMALSTSSCAHSLTGAGKAQVKMALIPRGTWTPFLAVHSLWASVRLDGAREGAYLVTHLLGIIIHNNFCVF